VFVEGVNIISDEMGNAGVVGGGVVQVFVLGSGSNLFEMGNVGVGIVVVVDINGLNVK
jgi:hypothetical protein